MNTECLIQETENRHGKEAPSRGLSSGPQDQTFLPHRAQSHKIKRHRGHPISIKISTTKNKNKNPENKCCEHGKKLEPMCILLGEVKWCSFQYKQYSSSSKIKNRLTRLLDIYQKELKKRNSKRYLYIHVHCSMIHNIQKVEVTQVSTDRRMDKQSVLYTHDEILFSFEKEENSGTCHNMDKSWEHYAK